MKKIKVSNKSTFVLLFFLFLLFLKVDFRLQTDIFCCSDDFDYYIHAETIALDFDLEYSNQLKGYENARFYSNNISAPIGFIGSGLLAAPFLLFGYLLDNLIQTSPFLNLKIYFYSISSIFYLIISMIFLIKSKNLIATKFKNLDLIIIFLGSGISYYSFERFSMTHTYEVFAITMVCYYSLKILVNKNAVYKFDYLILSFYFFLSFNIRWTNYFVFFIPFYLAGLLNVNFKFKNLKFLLYNISFLFLTIFLNFKIYGIATLNPNSVYSKGDLGQSINIFNNFFKVLKSIFTIVFSQEFGILYFSPVIFLGLVSLLYYLSIDIKKFNNYLGLAIFGQVFAIVVIWQSTASSYGFRYLYCLIPLSVLMSVNVFENYQFSGKNLLLKFIVSFSIFSLLSTIYFETTPLTQLSLDEEINSFGNLVRYTQPNYLKGYIFSFFNLESYLKIFVTSYLGLIIFNLIFKFIEINNFFEILNKIGLDLSNEKVTNLLVQYQEINLSYIFIVLLTVTIFTFIVSRMFQ